MKMELSQVPAGESYGTFRSAGIADYLQSAMGISVNGIVLVSSVLDIPHLLFSHTTIYLICLTCQLMRHILVPQ